MFFNAGRIHLPVNFRLLKMKNEYFPFIIGWELTLKCNLRCNHCASSAGSARNDELSIKETLSIATQFPELLVDEVIFTGGEPLLNPNWTTIGGYLTNHNIKVGMVSNGTIISDQIIDDMKKCGINAIGISLDGLENVHDHIRGIPGVFRKTIRGIENLIENKIKVTIITSVTSLNITTLEEIYNLVLSLGAWKWQLQPIYPLGRSSENKYLHLTSEQFFNLGEYIFNLRPIALKKGLEVVPADSCGYFSAFDFPEFRWQGCNAGRFSCGIMSDGRVKGCLSWPDTFIEGDLRKDDLWTIWFREGAFAKQRTLSEEDMQGNCSDCEVALQCGGGCQAMSLAATGVWRADPFCYRSIMNKLINVNSKAFYNES